MLPISLKIPNILFDQVKQSMADITSENKIFGNFSAKIFAEIKST